MGEFQTRTVEYQAGDLTCEGYLAQNVAGENRPAVVICHAWAGQGDHERAIAHKLAELGYVAFAADVYGKGVKGDPQGDNTALMAPLMQDRALLLHRLTAAVDTARGLPGVDPERVGAVGYCFGGLCVLDMARGNAAVKGVVSFHGVFAPNGLNQADPIAPKVLLCHGWDDPMGKPESVVAVAQELTQRKADWQLHAYGDAVHAFTIKGANNRAGGVQYDADADRRSWAAMDYFLKETLR